MRQFHYRHIAQARSQLARKKQTGSMMIEMALYLIIATMLLAVQLRQSLDLIDESNAIATGQYVSQIQAGVNLCIDRNRVGYTAPVVNVPVLPNPLSPTIADLVNAQCLSNSFNTSAPRSALGLSFTIALTRSASCTTSVSLCSISGYILSTQPLLDSDGQVRRGLLMTAVSSMGVDGGQVFNTNQNTLVGMGNSYSIVVPGLVNGDGYLGMRVGSGSGMLGLLAGYYKTDGTIPLAGTMDAANNDIKNVNNLTTSNLTVKGNTVLAGNAVANPGDLCTPAQKDSVQKNAAGNGLMYCNGSTWLSISTAVAGIGEGVPCAGTPVNQFGTTATGQGFVCNGQFWTAPQNFAIAGSDCVGSGQQAVSVSTKEALICKNSKYIKLSSLLIPAVETARTLVSDGTVVTKPTCDVTGTPSYSIALTQSVTDVAQVPPRQAFYVTTQDNGSSWTILIKLKDNQGGVFSASQYGVTAIFKSECSY